MTPPRIRTRSGRRPRARFHASWSPVARRRTRKTVLRLLGVVGGALIVLLLAANVYAVSFVNNLPSVHGLDASTFAGDTIILDRNGQQLADVGQQSQDQQGDRRINVTLAQVSLTLIQGTVSIEDRTFWTNPGFDTAAILRTAASNVRAGGITGGASTISQQLAKQLFLSPQQSLTRKAQELVLAYQLNQTYSKSKILELYLNHSYYGSQQYGVQAAANTYFHKDAKNVDLAHAAMLAGLPQAPDAYSPIDHVDLAKMRQKEVLDAMVRDGHITPREAVAAYDEPLQVYRPVNNSKAPLFVEYVEQELRNLGYKPGQQQLTVRTTLDLGKQLMAEQVIHDNLQANLGKDRGGLLNSAQVALDPKTGQIITYVGSAEDFNRSGGQIDFVSKTPLNPGSSVKPFTYAKALLDRHITMDTPILDGPSPYVLNLGGGQKYEVTNYDKKSHGVQPVRFTLPNSLNIPAVKVEVSEGVPNVVDFFRSLGMLPRADGNPNAPDTAYGPSLTLGGYPITLLEEATALSVIADMGTYHQPEGILSVVDTHGATLYAADPSHGARPGALDAGVAYIIAAILSNDANRQLIFGEGTPLHLGDRHAAAKTGTTDNFKDALTIGFTPDLASVVWVGDILGITHTMSGNQTDGVFVAAPAWHRFMEAALKGVRDSWYPMPADVTAKGDSYFLKDTPKVERLQGDNPSPSPSPNNGIPPDPGTGPQPVGLRCPPILPLPLPGCR